jgi:hypothetical protein
MKFSIKGAIRFLKKRALGAKAQAHECNECAISKLHNFV